MTENSAKPIGVSTAKLVPVVVKANHSLSGPGAEANMITIVDSTSNAGDAGRKKSGFVITRVDKTANAAATILENESDFENELNDHGAYAHDGGASSPGSSSILSDVSTVDGGSLERPLTMSRAPPPTPAGATPTSPAWPGQNQRPGGITAIITANSAVAGAAALLSAAANLGHQSSSQPSQVQQAVVISSQSPSAAPPSTINREASASSRFHIIKIETGPYKRGRWNCRDFDESASGSGSGAVRSDMIAVGPRSGSSSNSSGRPSFHLIADENGHGAGDHTLLLLAAASDHSATSHQHAHASQQQTGLASKPPLPSGHHHAHHPQQHSPLPATLPHSQQAKGADSQGTALPPSATPAAPSKGATISKQPSITSSQPSPAPASSASNSTPLSNIAQQQPHQRSQSPVVPSSPAPTTVSRFQVRPAAVDLNNAAAAILDSIVGSMHNDNNRIVIGAGGRQQASAITSSTAGPTAAGGATAIASVVGGPIGGGTAGMGQAAPGSVGANVVAIDNKIEQAMDLVKTHLLYAVREEVEVLKEKIIDLEKKVFRLETENKLLREYAPPEILQQIQHQQHHPQSQTGGNVNALVTSQANSIPPLAPVTQQQSISISQMQQQHSTTQPTITQAAPVLTSQHSVQGSAMTTVNAPVTAITTQALSSTPVQQQQPH